MPSFFLILLAILHTKFPTLNALSCKFELYLLEILSSVVPSLILAFSLLLTFKLRLVARQSWLISSSYCWRHKNNSLISTGIIASVSYTKLKRVSLVVGWGVHRYAYNTSNNSLSTLTESNLFFSFTKMILLAASTCPRLRVFYWTCCMLNVDPWVELHRSLSIKCCPLFVIIVLRIPYLQIMFFHIKH